MKNRMKKILGFLTVLCLLAGLLPQTALPAYADTTGGTGKAIQLVNEDNPSGGIADQNHIYFGRKDETHYTWTDEVPYWRVLDADKMNTGDAGMFLLSDKLIGNNPGGDYGLIYFNDNKTKGNAWQGSDAQGWCENFLINVFSGQERVSIAEISKNDDTSGSYGECALDKEKVFFLSVAEVTNSAYGFTDNNSREATFKDGNGTVQNGRWWLRSPNIYNDYVVGAVWNDDTGIVGSGVDVPHAARPAFNLDMSKVLFTSAAVDGKQSGAAGDDALTAVSAYSGNEWKLTIIDDDRNAFSATIDSRDEDDVTIKYSGAKSGENEYISAIIVNSAGEVTYYGKLAKASSADNSTCTVNVAGKLGDTDTLYVFNEQCNGDKKTDYASNLQVVVKPTLTITARDKTFPYCGKVTGVGDTIYADAAQIADMITVKGLQSGDKVGQVELFGQATEINTYPGRIMPRNAVIYDVGGHDVTENYEIVYVGGTLKIIDPTSVYDVSITPGTGMTKTDDSGALSQTAYNGDKIDDVVFTADNGYYFPEDYKVDAVNGISVTRDSDSQITVAGTPTGKAEIKLPAASKKEEPTHVHELTAVDAKEATCTEAGSKIYYTCSGCGKWFEDKTALVEITDKSSVTIKALGHKWDKGVVTKEATYTAEGVRTYTCERDSSHTKTEKIPKKQRRSSGGSERTSTTAAGGSWFKDDTGWHYRENGALLKETWRYIYYNDAYYWYYFDETGTIVTGWKQIGGKWYFFEPVEGRNQGRMYSNERTPDGYYVGADGAWDGNPASTAGGSTGAAN